MRRWSFVAAALACANPAAAGSYLDALDPTLEQQCFADERAAVRDRMIYAARFVACPDFSELPAKFRTLPMQADHIKLRADSAACRAYLERSWRQMVALAQASPEGRGAFCRAAQQRRDSAVGSPGTAPLEALIRSLEGALGKGEKLIGVWIDDMHPCGVVAVVATPRGPQKVLVCSDGSASGKVALQEIKPPTEGRRAWHTPGLKRRSITVLGERTVEYLDAKGQRHDYYQLVELRDGTLLLFEDGVGTVDGPVVALRARPFDVAAAKKGEAPRADADGRGSGDQVAALARETPSSALLLEIAPHGRPDMAPDRLTGRHSLRLREVYVGGGTWQVGCVPCFSVLTTIGIWRGEAYALNGTTRPQRQRYRLVVGRDSRAVRDIDDIRDKALWLQAAQMIGEAQKAPGCELAPIAGTGLTDRIFMAMRHGVCLGR
jgi:hypothetical protein